MSKRPFYGQKLHDHVDVCDRGRLTLAMMSFCEMIMNFCSAGQIFIFHSFKFCAGYPDVGVACHQLIPCLHLGHFLKTFSGLASAENLYSFHMGLPEFGRLFCWEIWQPEWNVIPTHNVWQQEHALKSGVTNEPKTVNILKFCFRWPTRDT